MNETGCIAFDFDGTLIKSGWDKLVHVMYAAYLACRETGFRRFCHPGDLEKDIERLLRAQLPHRGAPRFQQLAAIVNSMINDDADIVDAPGGLKIDTGLQHEYETVRERYDTVYSALNEAAAADYWRPFPMAKETLSELAGKFDLYIASGVPQGMLEAELERHAFDRALFRGIYGTDPSGSRDKARILLDIKAAGYSQLLFVGDSVKDQVYAASAGASFFRIDGDADFVRLVHSVQDGFPDETEPWDQTSQIVDGSRAAIRALLEEVTAGVEMTPQEVVRRLHT